MLEKEFNVIKTTKSLLKVQNILSLKKNNKLA